MTSRTPGGCPPSVQEVMGLIPVRDSYFFFVSRLCHVDLFTFHRFLHCLPHAHPPHFGNSRIPYFIRQDHHLLDIKYLCGSEKYLTILVFTSYYATFHPYDLNEYLFYKGNPHQFLTFQLTFKIISEGKIIRKKKRT